MDEGNQCPCKAYVGSVANVNSVQKFNHEGHRVHEEEQKKKSFKLPALGVPRGLFVNC